VEAIAAIPWFAWIPLSAIILGIASGTITTLVKQSQQHRERMAMIRMGMHPRRPPACRFDARRDAGLLRGGRRPVAASSCLRRRDQRPPPHWAKSLSRAATASPTRSLSSSYI
jgi:hypothetical protein